MLGLTRKESKFFINSLLGHAVLIAIAGFLGFLPSCEEEEEEVHVFELASASFVPPKPLIPKPPAPLPPPPPRTPSPPKPIVKPSVSDVPKKTTPVPKAIIKTPPPKIIPKKPKSKPKPQEVKPKPISIDQFKKDHKISSAPKPAPVPVRKAPKVRINPENFKLPTVKISKSTPQTSNVDPDLLNQYLGEVQAKLEEVWRRLQSESDISASGEAFLSFRISPSGSLIYPSISRSSGNRSLDQLVIRVSTSVGNLGRPPGGKLSSSLEIPFRVRY
jgi:TonB family protein